jgi:hypothetical protein
VGIGTGVEVAVMFVVIARVRVWLSSEAAMISWWTGIQLMKVFPNIKERYFGIYLSFKYKRKMSLK